MNSIEKYEFDRQGFIVIEQMLTSNEVASLAKAVDVLEADALERIDAPPQKMLESILRRTRYVAAEYDVPVMFVAAAKPLMMG